MGRLPECLLPVWLAQFFQSPYWAEVINTSFPRSQQSLFLSSSDDQEINRWLYSKALRKLPDLQGRLWHGAVVPRLVPDPAFISARPDSKGVGSRLTTSQSPLPHACDQNWGDMLFLGRRATSIWSPKCQLSGSNSLLSLLRHQRRPTPSTFPSLSPWHFLEQACAPSS